MKRVAIYRNVLLPRSETFIRDQALALRSWSATVVGNRRDVLGLDLRGLATQLPTVNATSQRIRFRLGRPDPTLVEFLRGSADLVHAHFGLDAVDIWPSVKQAGLPMLVTLHGYDIMTQPRWWLSGRGGVTRIAYPGRLTRLAREKRVGFIAVSEAIRRHAIGRGIPPEKIATHKIGIELSRFQPTEPTAGNRPPSVLFVGRLVEKKGVRFLVEAMVRVRQRVPDASLTIAGDGPLRSSLSKLAVELRVPVHFLGAVDVLGVRQNLDQARVLCLPSIVAANGDAEGFGMVLLEAQACGVPVVTSALGGATEGLSEGRTGFSFAEKDVDALTASLVALLTDDDLATDMSRAAPHFVRRNFDINTLTRSLELLYDYASSASQNNPGALQ